MFSLKKEVEYLGHNIINMLCVCVCVQKVIESLIKITKGLLQKFYIECYGSVCCPTIIIFHQQKNLVLDP